MLITRVPTVLIARVSTVHGFYSALSAVLDDSLRWHRCSQQIPFQVSSDLTFSKMTHLIGMLIPGPPQHGDADPEAAAEPAAAPAKAVTETTRFETRPTVAAPAPPRAPPRPRSSTSRCSTTLRASPSRSAPRPPPRPPPRGPPGCRGRGASTCPGSVTGAVPIVQLRQSAMAASYTPLNGHPCP